MPASADELKVARSWIGTSEDDVTFQERYDRLGSLDLAILESLRAQRAEMVLDQPTSFTIDNLSASYGQNIQELDKTIGEFISKGGTSGTGLAGNVTRMTRPNQR